MDRLGPYPAYKDSGVPWLGDVPAHWEVSRLKWACRLAYGDSMPAERRSDGPVPVYGSNGKVGWNNTANTLAPVIIVGRKGSYGKVAFSSRPVFAIDTTFYVDGRLTDHSIRWLYYLLTWAKLDTASKDSAVPGLDRNDAYERAVPLPPPSEQAAIVRYLDYVDARIRRYVRAKRRLIELLTEQAQVLTQTAANMTGTRSLRLGVVADKVTQLICRQPDQVYIPIGLYNRGRGIFHKPSTKGMDLGDSTFSWISEGDFVISGQFAWEGAIALAGPADEGCIASHRYPVLRGKPDVAESAYLLSFFKTGWGQLLLDHYSRGAAGRNRPLNIERLMKEKIPVPPLSAQKQITRLIHLESRLRQSVAQLTTILREYRTRLIADVVTGKLDVREVAARLPEASEEDLLEDELDNENSGEDLPDDDGELDAVDRELERS